MLSYETLAEPEPDSRSRPRSRSTPMLGLKIQITKALIKESYSQRSYTEYQISLRFGARRWVV